MLKTFNKTAAVAAVALFAGSVFAGKGEEAPQTRDLCQHVVVDGTYNLLFIRDGVYERFKYPKFRSIIPESGEWGPEYLLYREYDGAFLYDSMDDMNTMGASWKMRFRYQHNLGGICTLDNWNRSYQGWDLPWNEWNDAHWAILSGTKAAANCIPFPGTIDGYKIAIPSSVFIGVGDCAQAVSMQYPNATGAQVEPWRGDNWYTPCYAVVGHTKIDEPNDNTARRSCFFKDTVRPGGLHVDVMRDVETKGKKINSLQDCVDACKADIGAQNAQATGVTFDRGDKRCWYSIASETSYYSNEAQKHVMFAKPLAKPAPPEEVCKHVVVDGHYNKLFMINGESRNLIPTYQEVDIGTGDWGTKYLSMKPTGNLFLLDKSNTNFNQEFRNENNFGGVCALDNWNTYQRPYDAIDFAILSGNDAASKCIPFPGTIEGKKIEVTSVHGIGDCAQSVSVQYPDATGVQVDPWGARWTTKCYAVFGDTKIDEPNDNDARRSCFFKDTVRPGGLRVNIIRVVDTKGKKINSLQDCVDACKADIGAQNAQATGVTFDRGDKRCWYSIASETSYYSNEAQKHVVFAKPLARPASVVSAALKSALWWLNQ